MAPRASNKGVREVVLRAESEISKVSGGYDRYLEVEIVVASLRKFTSSNIARLFKFSIMQCIGNVESLCRDDSDEESSYTKG